jgi:translocation and assembly module TamB
MGTEVTVATGHLTVNQLQLPEASVRQLDVHADLEPGDELALTASADIDDLRNASLSAHLEGMWAASAIRVDSLEFHADQDHWRLARPSRITYRDGLEIDSLHLSAQGQEVTARGRISREGPLSLQVALTDFDVTMVGDLMGYPDLRGTLNASVEFGGTAEDPRLDAQLHTLLDPASPSPVDMTVSSHYEERELGFDARVAMTGGHGGKLTGYLPLALSFAGPSEGLLSRDSLQIEFLADSLPFGWASPLLPPALVRNLEAVLDGSVQIRGVTDAPTFDGSLDLKLASVALPGLGVRYEQGQAGLTFSGDGVRLDSLLIRSGGGSLSGSGSVRLSPLDQPEVDLTFLAERFQAVRTPAVDAVVSGTVGLSGPPARPSVSGRVEIDKANLYLADFTKAPDVRNVLLTEEDYREMASVFGYRPRDRSAPPSSLFEATSLDLDVELRRDSWVRQQSNPRLAVQFAGQMSVQKAPGDSLQLLGSIEGVPARSYVEQFGKRFSLADATLTFEGAPLSTQVVVKAEYEVPSRDNPDAPQVVIALNISGTPEFLSLELSSTPVLEASDMVSYLVTGRPADRSLEGGGGSLSSTGGALALSGLSGAVEAYAREQVGLDVVEITTDGLDGVTLVAGRFVSPSLYLGIRQPVSLQRTAGDASQRTPAPEIEVELEAIRWLLLNLQAGGLGGVQFYLRSRLAYD